MADGFSCEKRERTEGFGLEEREFRLENHRTRALKHKNKKIEKT